MTVLLPSATVNEGLRAIRQSGSSASMETVARLRLWIFLVLLALLFGKQLWVMRDTPSSVRAACSGGAWVAGRAGHPPAHRAITHNCPCLPSHMMHAGPLPSTCLQRKAAHKEAKGKAQVKSRVLSEPQPTPTQAPEQTCQAGTTPGVPCPDSAADPATTSTEGAAGNAAAALGAAAAATGASGATADKAPWVEIVSWQPRAYLHHNFLSEAEADHIVGLAEPRIKRNSVIHSNGTVSDDPIRTSWGTFLNRAFDEVIQAIELRLATWTHLPPENAEDMQVGGRLPGLGIDSGVGLLSGWQAGRLRRCGGGIALSWASLSGMHTTSGQHLTSPSAVLWC